MRLQMLWAAPLALAGTLPVAAQTAGTSAAPLEEVLVTARRREENLQNTPVAISAFTEAALERRQIFTTADLDRVTPNLQFASYGPLTGNNAAGRCSFAASGRPTAPPASTPA